MIGSQKLGSMFSNPNQKDYELFIELLGIGKVVPVIDKCYPLGEVPEALQ